MVSHRHRHSLVLGNKLHLSVFTAKSAEHVTDVIGPTPEAMGDRSGTVDVVRFALVMSQASYIKNTLTRAAPLRRLLVLFSLKQSLLEAWVLLCFRSRFLQASSCCLLTAVVPGSCIIRSC